MAFTANETFGELSELLTSPASQYWATRQDSNVHPVINILIKEIDGEGGYLLTVSNDLGAVVACCSLELSDHVAWISELFVSKKARRQGLATALVNAAGTIARQEAKVSIGAGISRSNPASMKLFGKLGFVMSFEDKEVFYVSRTL
ncbi:MAG: GNAT family N-acetyltransferase [Anaerolineales bacterium]|nr:GNAT family N-acetyltransferase [Anaerolineales bacterium]